MINELANAANKDKQQDRDNLKVIAERLIEINNRDDEKWKTQKRWHFIGSLVSWLSVILTAGNLFLVAVGLYYMPEETKRLFDTALSLFG